jgi:hypothetical protein
LPAGDYFSGGFLRDATGNLVTTSGGGGGGNTYTAAVLADSPVAYYRLGDAGATAPDQMGGPNGAYSGATAQAANLLPTQAGASTNFTGGQVNVPDSPASRLGAGAFSIEAWINFPAFVAWMALIDEASRAYTLLFTGDSAHWFVGAGGSASSGPNVGATLAAGQTYHVVVTVDAGNNFVSYINGTPASSTLGGHGATNSSTGFVIGGNPSGGGGPFSGRIQELALYNTVLSAARVAAHYAAA